MKRLLLAAAAAVSLGTPAAAQAPNVDARVKAVLPQVVAWRRDIHEHPELANQEVRTAGIVAAELRALGLEVRTGVAKTGVVGILRGGRPGGVIALRADMDALPVAEKTGLPFASKATATYNGAVTPVMHACGHDAHTAMLLGAARVLVGMREQVAGTIVFLFQPAEEGVPAGDTGGASLMVREGALDNPRPGAVFGLHVMRGPVGRVHVRKGGFMAGSDTFDIRLKGKGTHGAEPWNGIDLANLSSAIVQALNVVAARQIDVTESPTVVTVGLVQVGTRFNVIPDEARMAGTVRTFSPARRADVKARVDRIVEDLAHSYGATAELTWSGGNAPLVNDAELVERLGPALRAAAGAGGADLDARPVTMAEDFPSYGEKAPLLYAHVGSTPDFKDYASAPVNHSPQFNIDEAVLEVGVKAHVNVALAYLQQEAGPRRQSSR